MSKKLNDRVSEFETDVEKYIGEKFKDMPVESVMEFVAFLSYRIRTLMIDVAVDTRYNCMREFNKARKLYYKNGQSYGFPPSNNDDVPSGVGGES